MSEFIEGFLFPLNVIKSIPYLRVFGVMCSIIIFTNVMILIVKGFLIVWVLITAHTVRFIDKFKLDEISKKMGDK